MQEVLTRRTSWNSLITLWLDRKVGTMGAMDDAGARMISARAALERRDYVNALSEASLCVELTAKAFLDLCKVSYEMEEKGKKGRRLMHDVSSRIPELFSGVEYELTDEGKAADIQRYAKIFGRLAIMNRMVWSIREYVDFGIREMNLGAADLFSFEMSGLVEAIVRQAENIHLNLTSLYRDMAMDRVS